MRDSQSDSQPDHQPDSPASVLLDLNGPGPLHARLAGALRSAIRDGRLRQDSALPPSRVLAAELGCSRWVVTQAYAELVTAACWRPAHRLRHLGTPAGRGRSRQRPGRYRCQAGTAAGSQHRHGTGAARSAAVPRRAVGRGRPLRRRGPDHGRPRVSRSGRPPAAARGTCRVPRPGARRRRRPRRPDRLRQRHRRHRADLPRACAREDHRGRGRGSRLAAGQGGGGGRRADGRPYPRRPAGTARGPARRPGDVGAVILTPAHQFPSGAVLSPARRHELLDWARRTGGLLVEDDYDAEFRYDRRAVATLQGAAPWAVALVGSLSERCRPRSASAGWPRRRGGRRCCATPLRLRCSIARVRLVPAPAPTTVTCAPRASATATGATPWCASLRTRLPDATVSRVPAGLHLVVRLGPGLDGDAVRRRAARLGVRVASLSRYQVRPGQPGLVIGYGNLADHEVTAGVAFLAAAIVRAT